MQSVLYMTLFTALWLGVAETSAMPRRWWR